jgi:dsDNA-binding SOS-regulon protein
MNAKKRGRPSKKMLQIHGKDESETVKRAPMTLDEILGESLSVYTAQNSDEYRGQLTEMNMTDLQAHAYKVGLVPTEDRKVLMDRLVQEFSKWNSRYNMTAVIATGIKSMEDLDTNAKKILREGA